MNSSDTGSLFVGSQADCKSFVRTCKRHYVYVLRRPDGTPFYVGKGCGDRVFHHENEARHPNDWRSNAHKLNVIRSIWRTGQRVKYEIDFVDDHEAVALGREAALIQKLKRIHEGGPLTNLAPGGGISGGASPESREKHSATLSGIPDNNPDRATLNGFVLSIAAMKSVVIKPIGQFPLRPTQRYPSKGMSPTIRQAAALVGSAAANAISLAEACVVPRLLKVENVVGMIENGVANDIITSGLGSLIPSSDPKNEAFSLSSDQVRKVVGLVGRKRCYDLGVIDGVL